MTFLEHSYNCLRTVLLLSYYCLIPLFQKICYVRGESSYHLRLILFQSQNCLVLLSYTSLLCQRIHELSCQINLISILELSYCYLITVLFSSHNLLYHGGEKTYYLRTFLLQSQIYLITILSLSYFSLPHFSSLSELSSYHLIIVLLRSLLTSILSVTLCKPVTFVSLKSQKERENTCMCP